MGGESGSTSTGTTVNLDLGDIPDGGSPQPAGCQGKVDFLFVISRDPFMAWEQDVGGSIYDRLVATIPHFFATIEAKFSDFDYHILVTKGDAGWGDYYCEEECPGPFSEWCKPGNEYPCEYIPTACDQTFGAGVVFNAGRVAANKPCDIAGGKRYLTKDQPDLEETFACIAQVGASGSHLLGQALVAAVSPDINGPGGCNEGFLRDDALLVITLVTSSLDETSEGKPYEWFKKVRDAKQGDLSSIVMFFVGPPSLEYCEHPPWPNRLCQMFNQFPQRLAEDGLNEDYGAGFDAATDMIFEACSNFIPK